MFASLLLAIQESVSCDYLSNRLAILVLVGEIIVLISVVSGFNGLLSVELGFEDGYSFAELDYRLF